MCYTDIHNRKNTGEGLYNRPNEAVDLQFSTRSSTEHPETWIDPFSGEESPWDTSSQDALDALREKLTGSINCIRYTHPNEAYLATREAKASPVLESENQGFRETLFLPTEASTSKTADEITTVANVAWVRSLGGVCDDSGYPLGDSFSGDTNSDTETVNHPSHYNSGTIEVGDFIVDQGLNFCLGNVVKYVSRAGKKDHTKYREDILKAKWYLERELQRLSDDAVNY